MAAQSASAKRSTRSNGLQRSQTRSKVNVVSKASLALLNPAYAMGIEFDWESAQEESPSPASATPAAWHDATRGHSFDSSSSTSRNPTPELAAFATDASAYDAAHHQADVWDSDFDVAPVATADMRRTASGGSVFEDDEATELRDITKATDGARSTAARRQGGPAGPSFANNGSKSLSRLFTWKRSNTHAGGKPNKNTTTPVMISQPRWEVPNSAPAHMTTFEQASYALPPLAPMDASLLGSNSVPCTPVDAFTVSPLPNANTNTASILSPKVQHNLARKSSMPTLREVRRGMASPLTLHQASLPQASAQSVKSVYWTDAYQDDEYAHRHGAQSAQSVAPSSSASSFASSSSSQQYSTAPWHARPVIRISSVGKGVRKSSFDSAFPTQPTNIILTPDPQEIAAQRSAERSRSPRRKNKRFEPCAGAPNVPPLPSLAPRQPMPTERAARRRSRSLDAAMQPRLDLSPLPSLITPDGLFDTTIEEENEASHGPDRPNTADGDVVVSTTSDAQRVNLANRAVIVGVSSPKLVNFSPRLAQTSPSPRSPLSPMSQQQQPKRLSRQMASRLAAPVVVNVMPPTPDLGAQEHAMFDGEVPSPGVRRSLEMSNVYFGDVQQAVGDDKIAENADDSALDVIAKQCGASSPMSEVPCTSSDSTPEPDVVRDAAAAVRRRAASSMSEFSEISNGSVASMADEPFSFARSLSMMSLSSNGSSSELSDDGSGSDSSGDEMACVSKAKIVSVSTSVSSFAKAQLVSPRSAALASPRSPTKAEDGRMKSSFSSIASSLQSPQSSRSHGGSSLTSSASSGSKRNSGRFGSMPSLSSGQSLASVMTTSTSILDFGSDMAHDMMDGHSADKGLFPNPFAADLDGKKATAGKHDLRAPAEIQSMLDSVRITAADEDDCETPRLSGGFNAPMASTILQTRPLNVRKTSGANTTPNVLAATADPSSTSPGSSTSQLSPPPTTTTPGLSPPSIPRPYPRAQNSSSPHLELDLSLPLDLHGIGLGFEIDEEKPKRRGKSGKGDSRPKLPSKSRARQSLLLQQAQEKQAQQQGTAGQPKTPPSSGRLLASAMEQDAAMGLGLDLGLEGFTQEVERVRNLAPPASIDGNAAEDFLRLSDEERRLLLGAVEKKTALRSSRALRSASAAGDRSSMAYLRRESLRPGSADSNCSEATVRPPSMAGGEGAYAGAVGFAL